jgi:isopropylmalate/homocitrate/citramalate synthase
MASITPTPNPTREKIDVIDCTLRDGEQAAGVWFSLDEKITLAILLSDAGVTVLDAGFPASSQADIEAMLGMREAGISARIAATARPVLGDLIAATHAKADEVFLFMPTSDLRLEQTLNLTREQAKTRFRASAENVVEFGMTLNLVFEDATRTEITCLLETAISIAETAPVRRLILADTVGCATPKSMAALVKALRDELPASIDIAPHCHNDFGLATANTCAAVEAGARSVTCTVNGIGERAGNADLAETLASLTHLYGFDHGVDPMMLPHLARMVEQASCSRMSLLKPVVGYNVYRHESGIHVDGMLKTRQSYEFLPAAWTGRDHEFVLGKHSGMGLVRDILVRQGLEPSPPELRALLDLVKDWAISRRKPTLRASEDLPGISPVRVVEEFMKMRKGSAKHAS